MRLLVNGKPHEHAGDGTLLALLAECGAVPERVAVMVNDDVVPRQRRAAYRLKADDRVEIVAFAPGG